MLEPLEPKRPLATFTVTSGSDSRLVEGSLPWAVHQANYASAGPDVIQFNLPAAARTIRLRDTLYLNEQVVINGFTQPGGTAGIPPVTVLGTPTVATLFLLQADPSQGTTSIGSTIRGLAMAQYAANAVTILKGSSGNTIERNWIGFSVDPGGAVRPTATAGTYQAAIGIQANDNVVRDNTIAGVYNGIVMGEDILRTWSGTVYSGNTIRDNRIGTNPAGTSATGYGNRSDGIFFGAGCQRNVVGPGNVLSGNASAGVEFLHSSVTGNVVFANKIGTNAAGTVAIGNGELGVLVANGAAGNTIGGPSGGNLIAGNRLGGVALGTAAFRGASGNTVQGNVIGMNAAKSGALGTQQVGISVAASAARNVLEANEIGGHLQHGIVLSQAASTTVSRNFLGRSAAGRLVANGAYGVAVLPGSTSTTGTGNVFGTNRRGKVFASPLAKTTRVT